MSRYKLGNADKYKTICKQIINRYKLRNPEKYKAICKESIDRYKVGNANKYKTIRKQIINRYKIRNPEKYKAICKESIDRYKVGNADKYKAISKKSVSWHKIRHLDDYKEICKKYRKNHNAKNAERIRALNQKRKKTFKLRQSSNLKENTSCAAKSLSWFTQNTENQNVSKIIKTFHDLIQEGPEYICTCCDQLWYRSSVLECKQDAYNEFIDIPSDLFISNVRSIDNKEWICRACHNNLKQHKVPTCSKEMACPFLRNQTY